MRRLLVVVASLALCGAMLSAAGQAETKQATAGPAVTSAGTFPVTGAPSTLRVFAVDTWSASNPGWDIETNWFTTYYEKKTNVHIQWELASGTAQEMRQKMNLKLASGDYPDVFSMCGFSRAEQVKYGSEGIFVPLNQLIDAQTVHVKKAMQDIDKLRSSCTTPDGNIYGLPSPVMYVHGTMPNKLWIYKPWMDKLGLAMPETTEQFYQVLKAFKDKDPNGNGKKDEVPYASVGANYVFLMNSFAWYDGGNLKADKGKVSFVPNKDEFREGLKYLRRLYKDELYLKDFFTIDTKQVREIAEPKPAALGAATALWPGTFARNVDADSNFWGYQPVMPLQGPQGVRQHPFTHLALGPGGANWNVTKACSSPALAMRWIDWIWSFEGYHTASHGPMLPASAEEGPGWRPGRAGEEGADGKPALVKRAPTKDPNAYSNANWGTSQIVPRYLAYEWHTGLVIDKDDPYRSRDLYDATKRMEAWKVDLVVPPLFMTEAASSEVAELETALGNAVREASAQFIFGSRDIGSDADWNRFRDDLAKLGVERYLQLYQTEYDRNYARK